MKNEKKTAKRVLILNWRDIKNPSAGGAEILTHEIAKRLVKDGFDVTLFTSHYPKGRKDEVVDGVKIIRQGKPDIRFLLSSVHYKAYRYYKKNFEGNVEYVIDEVHGVPFFTPLYVREKKIALICEVAGKIWDITFNFPFNLFGKLTEKIYPNLYKNVKALTISKSSKSDLEKIGFDGRNIKIIPPGCDVPIIKNKPKKYSDPSLVFVGRLTKSKGIEDAIDAVAKIKEKHPEIMLHILGRGKNDYVQYLKKICHEKNLDNNVKFHGFVNDKKKIKLLEKAHILLSPSQKEGWGLTVHEAGARGTPCVVYDVEGLKEVVINNKNGIICSKNSPKVMAKNAMRILQDASLYKKLQEGAIQESKKFTWKSAYKEFKKVV